jgi:DNA-binding transcriptional MerR regulator
MSASPAPAYLGIGEVLAQLRAEFPDIRVSKIRFLEAEGLISPARSPSRYRRFSPDDVQRLRYILTAQRDQYLPLRVIKEQLGRPGQAAAPARGAGQVAQAQARRGVQLSRRELLEAAGITEDQLAELEAYGLVRRAGRHYGQDGLDVAVAAAALASYGVQARHLRTVRAAVEREVSLIEQVVAPTLRQRNQQARQAASQTAQEIAALLLPLHRALVESALAEAGLPGAVPAGRDAAAPPAAGPASQLAGGLASRGVEGASA